MVVWAVAEALVIADLDQSPTALAAATALSTQLKETVASSVDNGAVRAWAALELLQFVRSVSA